MVRTGWLAGVATTSLSCALVGGVVALAGCDKAAAHKPIVLNPTPRQATPTTSASRPAGPTLTTQPATQAAEKKLSHIAINGVWIEFPEAKLMVHKDGDKLSAFLVSNDPPEVINPTYQGNRYYFEMTLDGVDDVKNITEAEYRYRGSSAEPEDTPCGIFLDGDRQHFQPYDIQVLFDKKDDHLIATIQGKFLYFPKGSQVGQWVAVHGELAAKPEVK
jgi:hypothetical protein